jgi:hypothetical protein
MEKSKGQSINKKSQELSINMIVVGVLALLVMVIVIVLIFYGGEIMGSFGGFGVQEEELAVTTFKNTCTGKCRTLQSFNIPSGKTLTQDQMTQVKGFCCESYDLNANTYIDLSTELGPEICSLAYPNCGSRSSAVLCQGSYSRSSINPLTGQAIYTQTFFDFTKTQDYYKNVIMDGSSTPTQELVESCRLPTEP